MGGVAVFGFDMLSGSTASSNLIPMSIDAISTNNGGQLHLSITLANQGNKAIDAATASSSFMPSSIDGRPTNDKMMYFPLRTNTGGVDDGDYVSGYQTLSVRGMIEEGEKGWGAGESLTAGSRCGVGGPDFEGSLQKGEGYSSLKNALHIKAMDELEDHPAPLYQTDDHKGDKGAILCVLELGAYPGDEIIIDMQILFVDGEMMEKIIQAVVR